MKESHFEKWVQAERNRSLPPCPAGIEASVLRRIRMESAEAGASGLFEGLFGIPRSGLVLGAMALAVLLSSATSMVVISRHVPTTGTRELAVNALDFGIFNEVHVINLGEGIDDE